MHAPRIGACAVTLDGFTYLDHEISHRPERIVEAVVSPFAEFVYQVACLDELEQHVGHLRQQAAIVPCVDIHRLVAGDLGRREGDEMALEQFAATELQRYLQHMTGAQLPVRFGVRNARRIVINGRARGLGDGDAFALRRSGSAL